MSIPGVSETEKRKLLILREPERQRVKIVDRHDPERFLCVTDRVRMTGPRNYITAQLDRLFPEGYEFLSDFDYFFPVEPPKPNAAFLEAIELFAMSQHEWRKRHAE